MDAHNSICPLCHRPFNHGATRCQGCLNRIVYGATPQELAEAWRSGMTVGALGGIFVTGLIPQLLNDLFGWAIPIGLGLGFGSLILVLVIGVMSGYYARWAKAEAMRDRIRVFDQP